MNRDRTVKRMLVNATQPEECRVAMVDGQFLYDLDIEVAARGQRKANIYKAKVTRVEPSLEAAFVDFGVERHGFLPFKEIAREYYAEKKSDSGEPLAVKDAISEGQELLVQVEKEERGRKGAALTTFPSLAGRYLVLMPNNPRAGGISRRIEGDDRAELREALSALEVPAGMGLIVRTAGVGKSQEELQWDLDYLLKLWNAIETAVNERSGPFLVYQESNVIIRAIRDYFSKDVNEILIDDEDVYRQARDFITQVMPESAGRVRHYGGPVPLFSRFQIESQIESAFSHSVRLPSGGSIVFGHTEALVSIDVNSARATKGGDIEETALNTNLEAADELARQLRLRDVGGLIVIDFIDMTPARNQREVESRLREALRHDRARVQIGRISRFGLLEMSRQRLRSSLGESSLQMCPTCTGRGYVRGPESLALSILRIVEEEAMKDMTGRIVARLPIEVATFLLNEKREEVVEIERRTGTGIILVPDTSMTLSSYEVERVRAEDTSHVSAREASYDLTADADSAQSFARETASPPDEPAVKVAPPPAPPPAPPSQPPRTHAPKKVGMLARLWKSLFGVRQEPQRKPSPRQRPASGSGTSHGARRNLREASSREGADSRRRGGGASRRGGSRGGNGDGRRRRDSRASSPGAAAVAAEPVAPESGQSTKPASEPQSRSGRRGSRRGRRGGARTRNRDNAGAAPEGATSREPASGSSEPGDSAGHGRTRAGAASDASTPDVPATGRTGAKSDGGGTRSAVGDRTSGVPKPATDASRDSTWRPPVAPPQERAAAPRDTDRAPAEAESIAPSASPRTGQRQTGAAEPAEMKVSTEAAED